ncbi:hypothetical protein LTS18_009431, partial [Coniosporium uncinatum]
GIEEETQIGATGEAHGAHAESVVQQKSAPQDPETAPFTEAIAGLPVTGESEAMEDVKPTSTEETTPAPVGPTAPTETASPIIAEPPPPEVVDQGLRPPKDLPPPDDPLAPTTQPDSTTRSDSSPGPSSSKRPTTVYLAPSSSTPQAARFSHNDSDYEPSIEHAKQHQAMLANATRNKKLPSDAEIAAAEEEKRQRLDRVAGVTIRVRLPDGSAAESTFARSETAADVYTWAEGLLASKDAEFRLQYLGDNGRPATLSRGNERLVDDLRMQGKVLITFAWEDTAPASVRTKPVLAEEWSGKAVKMQVSEPEREPEKKEGEEKGKGGILGLGKKKEGGGGGSMADKEARLKKLMGFGRK